MKGYNYAEAWKKNKLRYYRELNKYTQVQISKELGIAQNMYQKYESGKLQPSIALVIKLSDIYGVTVKELCGYEK